MAYAQRPQENDEIVLFEADVVTRENSASPIVAEGDVKAYFGDQFLTSDRVTYDPEKDIVTASGNVTITDVSGQTFFADEVELTGDLADGIATNFSAILEDDSKLAGTTVIKTGDERNELTKAVYTACDVCKENGEPKTPSWRVKAQQVTQDKEDEVIRFNNAVFEVLGVPAFYSPYLQIPDPSVERKSGFLTPDFGTTTQQGIYLEVPYYIAISDYQDITFYPKVMERQGVLYQGEYRLNSRGGGLVLQAGFIETRKSEIADSPFSLPDTRFHAYGAGYQEFAQNWELGFDADYVSDKGYVRTYNSLPKGDLLDSSGVFRPDRLSSEFYIDRRTDNNFFAIEALGFQSLRGNEDNDFAAQALPRIQYTGKIFDTPLVGGQTAFTANLVTLFRQEGLDSIRGTLATEWNRVVTLTSGQRLRFFAELRADAYGYQQIDQGNELCNTTDSNFAECSNMFPDQGQDDKTTEARILPTAGVEWTYPFVRRNEDSTIIIEPRVQFVVSTDEEFNEEVVLPDGSVVFVNEIINEDSQFFQFDTTSLFDWNKSSGFDLWENGSRVNVGISSTAVFDSGITVEGSIGQQFRSAPTNIYRAFGLEPGLGETESDIVAAFDLSWDGLFSIDNRFRFDKDDGSIRRAESQFRGGYGPVNSSVSYVKVQTGQTAGTGRSDEFLTAAVSYDLTDHWTLGGSWREDIAAGQTTSQIVSLGYRDECSRILISYRIDNTNADGFKFGDSLNINLELAGFNN